MKARRLKWPLAFRIVTPRLVLRCWEPCDAPALARSIQESMDSLSTWLPWAANDTCTADAKLELIRKWRIEFERGGTFAYGIFWREDESRVLGSVGSHDRIGAGARELGYWIRPDVARRGLMTEAAGAMTRVGFEIQRLRRMEIHCSPRNIASAGVPRRLGFTHTHSFDMLVLTPEASPRDSMIWTLLRADYPGSNAAGLAVEAFDPLGRPIPLAAPVREPVPLNPG